MDDVRRQMASIVKCWRRLPRGQRFALAAVLCASAVGFLLLLNHANENVWESVRGGREFSKLELTAIQAAWRKSGLRESRVDGQRLYVPKSQITRYEAQLPKSHSNDADSESELEKQLSRSNLFTTHEEREQFKDIALRRDLQRVIRAIPAIADADVIWARSKNKTPFSSRSKVTATVNVTPRDGHDLTPQLVQSLRTVVASLVPDLDPQDVVVLDQLTGLAITDEHDSAVSQQQHHRQQERLAKQLETKIATALAHIPDIQVQVTSNQHAANQPGWQVTVSVPSRYFDAVTAQRILDEDQSFLVVSPHGTSSELVQESECTRLRKFVICLLRNDHPSAQVAVVPIAGDTPFNQAADETPFAAWPHVICAALSVLLVASVPRPRRRATRSGNAVVPQSPTLPPQSLTISSNVETSSPVVMTESRKPHSIEQPQPLPHCESPSCSRDSRAQAINDIDQLQQLDPQRLAGVLKDERAQTIAVLLTRLPARHVSATLACLPASLQVDIIRRLKSLGDVANELVAEIARSVWHRASSQSTWNHQATEVGATGGPWSPSISGRERNIAGTLASISPENPEIEHGIDDTSSEPTAAPTEQQSKHRPPNSTRRAFA